MSTPADAEVILAQIREWLKAGATIRATDPNDPLLLSKLPDGRWHSGMTVTGASQ